MALERITKVGGISLEDPLNFTGGLNVTGVATATGGIDAIGIHSGGVAIHSGIITALNFVGTGNTFAVHNNRVDISISGGGGGGIVYNTDTIGKILFLHTSKFESNTSISSPQKFGEVFTHTDVTVDIETGVTVDIDDGCILLVTDKTDFDISFFGDPAQGSNVYRGSAFDDNIQTVFTSNIRLENTQIGYGKMPAELQDDISYDIDSGVTVDVDDSALLIL